MNPRVLTVKNIQDLMLVCESTAYSIVRQAIATKSFPVIKRGRIYRIPTQPFLDWLDEGGELVETD